MASTYSTSLQIQLVGNGEQSGVWGTSTNTNWNLIEQAVAGVVNITMTNTNYTLSVLNGVSDEARNMVLFVGGSNSAVRQVIAPLVPKVYTVYNNTSGGYAISIGGTSGTTVTIPSGTSSQVFCNGTNFYSGISAATGNFTIPGNNAVAGNETIGGTLGVTGAITASGGVVGNAATATSLVAGGTNQIPYQSATGTTAYIAAPAITNTYLYWDGSALGWGISPSGLVANGAIFQNNNTVAVSYALTIGTNGMSAGPLTVGSGVTVTIPTGSRWVIL